MESESSNHITIVYELLKQIHDAILLLQECNKDVNDFHDLEMSSSGMQRLAGNCMLIQAIGENIKKIDKYTDGKFFLSRPEIPWKKAMGMRDRISHGYFEIDTGFVEDIITNDLAPLLVAIDSLIAETEKQLLEQQVDEHQEGIE